MKKITIVGLGYVGVPLAIAFHNKGFDVTGLDVSEKAVKRITEGKFPESVVNKPKNLMKATLNPEECLPNSDFIIVCVPTPLTKDKKEDTKYLIAATTTISKYLKKGQTVIIESTTYPGTTEEVIKPILEKSGLKVGIDFGLAYSPERVDPGNLYPLEKIPKIVAGINRKYGEIVRDLYSQIIERVVLVDSIKVAETTKVFENTFRQVNIAFVNEFALFCEKSGINAYDVIKAASTKHAGFMAHYPGSGVGGDCIPVTPLFLSQKAKEYGLDFKFIELADKLNSQMPLHVVELVEKNADKQKPVLVLGISYKPNVSDMRNSPTEVIIQNLKSKGWKVHYFDPHVKSFSDFTSEENLENAIDKCDTAVLSVAHDYFKKHDLENLLKNKVVIDTCNFFTGNCGRKYIGLGKPVK